MSSVLDRIEQLPPHKQELLVSQLDPASFGQQRLWLLHQLQPDNAAYHIFMAVRLGGELDIHALQSALATVVRRHAVLRASFSLVAGRLVQLVHPEIAVKMDIIDLTHLASSDHGAAIDEHAKVEFRKPFDLRVGPPMRVQLLRLGMFDHVILATLHHVVFDGWSRQVFLAELAESYAAARAGTAPKLPPLPMQYADFARWQRRWLTDDALKKQLDFWRVQLEDLPTRLPLPFDLAQSTELTFAGAHVRFEVPGDIAGDARALCKSLAITPFMLLLGAFKVLLHRYCSTADIAVGTPVAGRSRAELENLIGYFSNTVVLRSNLSGNPSFLAVLQQLRQVAIDAYAHEDIPFEKLVDELRPQRELDVTPLFQVMFSMQNTAAQVPAFPGLTLNAVAFEPNAAQFDLSLAMLDSGEAFVGTFEYKLNVFDAAAASRLAGHYVHILRQLIAAPEQKIGEVELLDEMQRHRVIREWNQTSARTDREALLHQLFERAAVASPEAVAVAHGDQRLTYRELDHWANRIGRELLRMDLPTESRIAIFMERGVAAIAALLGTLKAGCAYVPLDAELPPARLNQMLRDCRPEAIITQPNLQPVLATLPATAGTPSIFLDSVPTDLDTQSDELGSRDLTPQHVAYVIYTSGSTGEPKGIMVEHASVVNLICDWNRRYADRASDKPMTCSLWTNLGFDVSVFEIFAPLASGAAIEIVPEAVRADVPALIDWLGQRRIEAAYLPPFMIRQLKEVPDARLAALQLRLVLVGVEPLREADLLRFESLLPALKVVNGYGPTEATIFATSYDTCRDVARNAPIGRPVGNARVYILDEYLEPVPPGIVGEIYIGGAPLARGYMNLPGMTASRFIPDAFSGEHGARLYRTGDLGRWLPDGNIEYRGRNDFQLKIRGFRVDPGDIAAHIGRNPAVREVAVVASDDDRRERFLIAYVTPTAESTIDLADLRKQLSATLPGYMVPSAFVVMDQLPLTRNGKLNRSALPPPDTAALRTQPYEPPLGSIEEGLARVWAHTLRVERVGRHDNFFELGGHSLSAMQMVALIREHSGVDVPLRVIFQMPTLAHLGTHLAAKLAEQRLPADASTTSNASYEVGTID